MRRSASIRLTLLPWLASAALAQTEAACTAPRCADPPRTPSSATWPREADDCFADARDDDCSGPAADIANARPIDPSDLFVATRDDDDDDDDDDNDDTTQFAVSSQVRSPVSGTVNVPPSRGGFGSYFGRSGG